MCYKASKLPDLSCFSAYNLINLIISADRRIDRPKGKGKWENLAVMFTDNKNIEDLPKPKNEETNSYIDTPGISQPSLTHKAPPIICSRRQFQILLLFQK